MTGKFWTSTRFRLRTLLCGVALCAIICFYFGTKMRVYRAEQRAIAHLSADVSRVEWDGPAWLRLVLGGWNIFNRATLVSLSDDRTTDTDLDNLRYLTRVHHLKIHGTMITDAGLEHAKKMHQLQELWLSCPKMTDAGVNGLSRLEQLEVLAVTVPSITDTALIEISKIEHLTELDLGTTCISDRGVKYLLKLQNLKYLDVRWTSVSTEGVRQLEEGFPDGITLLHD